MPRPLLVAVPAQVGRSRASPLPPSCVSAPMASSAFWAPPLTKSTRRRGPFGLRVRCSHPCPSPSKIGHPGARPLAPPPEPTALRFGPPAPVDAPQARASTWTGSASIGPPYHSAPPRPQGVRHIRLSSSWQRESGCPPEMQTFCPRPPRRPGPRPARRLPLRRRARPPPRRLPLRRRGRSLGYPLIRCMPVSRRYCGARAGKRSVAAM